MDETQTLDAELQEVFESDFLSDDMVGPMPGDTLPRPFEAVLDTAVLVHAHPLGQPAAEEAIVAEAPRWEEGLEPLQRVDHPGHRSEVLAAIALITILIIYNFKHLGRLLAFFWEDTVKIRQGRGNVFDERPSSDIPIQIFLILVAIVCGGILLGGFVDLSRGIHEGVPSVLLRTVGAAAALFVFDYCAYQLVGYTFTTPHGRAEWVRGFTGSMALLGIALTIPASLSVFYPSMLPWAILTGLFAWIIAKILFIIKGFRIFYDNFTGILYFILYLCTLEMIPLLWVYRLSLY